MQPLRSSAEAIPAFAGRHHCSRRIAALRFFRSQRTRRRIPRVRFFRNQITSDVLFGLTWRAIGAGRIERPPRGLRPRMLPLHHAPSIFQGAEHERTRSQYAGKPATGSLGLCFAATRVMLAGTQKTACISTWRHRLRSRSRVQIRTDLNPAPGSPAGLRLGNSDARLSRDWFRGTLV